MGRKLFAGSLISEDETLTLFSKRKKPGFLELDLSINRYFHLKISVLSDFLIIFTGEPEYENMFLSRFLYSGARSLDPIQS